MKDEEFKFKSLAIMVGIHNLGKVNLLIVSGSLYQNCKYRPYPNIEHDLLWLIGLILPSFTKILTAMKYDMKALID